jgi:hypothetical protein
VARDGAHEWPVLALGAQRRVDLPQRPGRRRRRADPHQAGREVGGDGRRLLLGHPVRRFGHEDDVDVGDVVQLAPTGLAHGDDRQAGAPGIRPDLVAGDHESGLQRRLRQVGQGRGRLREGHEWVAGREVQGRDLEQLFAVCRAQDVDGRRTLGGAHRLDEPLDALLRGEGLRPRDGAPLVRVGAQVVAEGRRAAQHREQALTRRAGRGQRLGDRAAESGIATDDLHEAHQPEQGAVRVRDTGQRSGQPVVLDVLAGVDEAGERRVLQQAERASSIVEPQPRDGDGDRPGTARAHPGAGQRRGR